MERRRKEKAAMNDADVPVATQVDETQQEEQQDEGDIAPTRAKKRRQEELQQLKAQEEERIAEMIRELEERDPDLPLDEARDIVLKKMQRMK